MSRCPICGGELRPGQTFCGSACRRTAARLRSDPLGTYAALLARSRQVCQGCGTPMPQKRLGARWCSTACRGQHRVQKLVTAA